MYSQQPLCLTGNYRTNNGSETLFWWKYLKHWQSYDVSESYSSIYYMSGYKNSVYELSSVTLEIQLSGFVCFAEKADTETNQDFQSDRENISCKQPGPQTACTEMSNIAMSMTRAEAQSLKFLTPCLMAALCTHQWESLYHNLFIHRTGEIEFQHTVLSKLMNADEPFGLLIQNPVLIL